VREGLVVLGGEKRFFVGVFTSLLGVTGFLGDLPTMLATLAAGALALAGEQSRSSNWLQVIFRGLAVGKRLFVGEGTME